MTLADRLAGVLLAQGPMPGCVLATEVRKQKAVVLEVLHANPTRFVLTGKARASRWSVCEEPRMEGTRRPVEPSAGATFTVDDLSKLAKCDAAMVRTLVFGSEGFLERGYVESVDGNGTLAVTERGLHFSWILNGTRL